MIKKKKPLLIENHSLKVPDTHRVPHDDEDVRAEGIVNVLRDIQVDKVTKMMVHVHPYQKNRQKQAQLL